MLAEEITGEVVPAVENGEQFRVVIRRSGRIISDHLADTALDARAALGSMLIAIQQARAQVG